MAQQLDPTRLSPADVAAVMNKSGGQVSEANVREDLAAGAPQNADGTIHLIHYTAWLASQAD
jgi:hypothetical protein